MSALDLGDRLGHYEILSEVQEGRQWRVQDGQSGGDEWMLYRGPSAQSPEDWEAGFAQAEKTLSWITHPGLLKPRNFYLHDGDIYWVCALPGNLRISDYLQLHAPVLPKLVAWLADLCSLLQECHQAPQPIFWGRPSLANLRVQESQIQLLGLEMDAHFQLIFRTLDAQAPPAPGPLDARADVFGLATLLTEMVARGSGMAREGYRRNQALRKLMVAATAADPARRPASLSSLKIQLEKIPRVKPPATVKMGRFTLVLERYQLYALPLSVAGCLLCCALAAGLAQPLVAPPRHLPRPRKPGTRARPQLPAARVFREANPPAPPTARPPEST